MKRIILMIGFLSVGSLSAQINVNSNVNKNDTSNSFLDASQNATNFGNSVGRGLNFPHTDLSVFKLKNTDEVETPNFYDGMIVYNTKNGGSTNDPALAVQTQDLKPGFYYFSNPNGTTNQSVRQGKWVKLAGDALSSNEILWERDNANSVIKLKPSTTGSTPRTTNNIFIKDNGKVGINYNNPQYLLDIKGIGGGYNENSIGLRVFRESTLSGGLDFFKARGTAAAPAAIQKGDYLGSIGFTGYNGTNYLNSFRIAAIVTGDISTDSNNPTTSYDSSLHFMKETGIAAGTTLMTIHHTEM